MAPECFLKHYGFLTSLKASVSLTLIKVDNKIQLLRFPVTKLPNKTNFFFSYFTANMF